MSIVPTRSELPLHSFPFNAQHPSFVPRKNMRRRLRAQIPEPRIAVAGTSCQKVASGRKRGTENWRGVPRERRRAPCCWPDFENGLRRAMDHEDVFGREGVRGMREDILFDGFRDRDSGGRAGRCCVCGERYVERERYRVLVLLQQSSVMRTRGVTRRELTHFCVELVYNRLEALSRDVCREIDGRREGLSVLFTDKLHYDVRRRLRQLWLWRRNAVVDLLSLWGWK